MAAFASGLHVRLGAHDVLQKPIVADAGLVWAVCENL